MAYYIDFDALESLDKEIQETLKNEVDDFMSQDHLRQSILLNRHLLINSYVIDIMNDIRDYVTDLFNKRVEDLIQEVNETIEVGEVCEDDEDVWDSEPSWDSKLDADVEELAKELDEVEKRFQERVQGAGIGESNKPEPIDWGPEWEGF